MEAVKLPELGEPLATRFLGPLYTGIMRFGNEALSQSLRPDIRWTLIEAFAGFEDSAGAFVDSLHLAQRRHAALPLP